MPAGDVERLVIYQIGALQGIATANGTAVSHVKIHGALSNMACVDTDLAMAIARGIKAVDPSLIFLVPICSERSEEHTSELQSLMRISYAVLCLKKKKINATHIRLSTLHHISDANA